MKWSIKELSIHPAVCDAWELPESDARFAALVEDIREHGILEPLRITTAGEVVDGRHRLRAARQLKLDEVPCAVLHTGLDPAGIAISSLANRRHVSSKGQLAYAAYPLFARHHEELRRANRANPREASQAGTIEDIVGKLGIGREIFKQAARLHDAFAKDAGLKDRWEPLIMAADDPIGLGAALAGIAGQQASTDQTPKRNSHLARWVSAWSHVARPAQAWDRWDEVQRAKAGEAVSAAIEALPDPLLDVVTTALRTARRSRSGAES